MVTLIASSAASDASVYLLPRFEKRAPDLSREVRASAERERERERERVAGEFQISRHAGFLCLERGGTFRDAGDITRLRRDAAEKASRIASKR